MRASTTKDGLTLRVVGGTTSVMIGIDLEGKRRKGCLGFSIRRTDLGPEGQPLTTLARPAFLPNMLRFPSDTSAGPITTEHAPLQKFRWGDYTTLPHRRYRYQVVPRFGTPAQLLPSPIGDGDGVSVEITTEDPASPATSVSFNRAAAASRAFELEFPTITTEELLLGNTPQAMDARQWLSRGLEEAALAFLAKAADKTFALHAAIYEFQKPDLLAALKDAIVRGVEVQVVYHHRQKTLTGGQPDPKDVTAGKNDAAAHAAGLDAVCVKREADPQDAIMHDKFVVLLRRVAGSLQPQAVWTGSMNWTDGAIYGQLNVGHAVYEPEVAAIYEDCFQLLHADPAEAAQKEALAKLTPVPSAVPPGHQTTPILSPQYDLGMLDLYAGICKAATCLMVSAPFELHEKIRQALLNRPAGTVHYLLLDSKKVLGKPEEVQVQQGDPSNTISVATTLPSPLHDFQGKLLEGHESFLHEGIHIHCKIILADPFGSDPVLVTGSANYSAASTTMNDENSLLIRGDMAVCDIYVTEFMRMFEHYHFRASLAAAPGGVTLSLKENDTWSDPYYVPGSIKELDRHIFAGTLV